MFSSDLAILRVSAAYPDFHNTIEPVRRTERLWADGTICRFVAWGECDAILTSIDAINLILSSGAATVANPAIQPDLRVINAPILNREACNQPAVHANRVLSSHICAGSVPVTNPVAGACGGNIGSGLYCNNELIGLLTFGQSCGAANIPGVYTNLIQYRDWIDAQLGRTDNPQPGWSPTPN
jgi:Trypsin